MTILCTNPWTSRKAPLITFALGNDARSARVATRAAILSATCCPLAIIGAEPSAICASDEFNLLRDTAASSRKRPLALAVSVAGCSAAAPSIAASFAAATSSATAGSGFPRNPGIVLFTCLKSMAESLDFRSPAASASRAPALRRRGAGMTSITSTAGHVSAAASVEVEIPGAADVSERG